MTIKKGAIALNHTAREPEKTRARKDNITTKPMSGF